MRCRPLNERETGLNCENIIDIYGNTGQCSIINPNDRKSPAKNFFFDGAFECSSTTECIYNEVACPLIDGVTEGYNGTIFAYGQTGCGKSFTMQGIQDSTPQVGIIPRQVKTFFINISYCAYSMYGVMNNYFLNRTRVEDL